MNFYSIEEKELLYNILGGKRFFYTLTVIEEIDIDKIILDSILEGNYQQLIKNYSVRAIDSNLEHGDQECATLVKSRRILMLYTFVNSVVLKKVPLYINRIPEVTKWRLIIQK